MQLDHLVAQKNHNWLKPPGYRLDTIHYEASAVGVYFAPKGDPNAPEVSFYISLFVTVICALSSLIFKKNFISFFYYQYHFLTKSNVILYVSFVTLM